MTLFGLFGKKKVEQAMQPANTQTVTSPEVPAVTQVAQPQEATQTATPLPPPPIAPVVPAVEEPKKAPEVKTLELVEQLEKKPTSIRPENHPHAFVIIPFGKKKGADGSIYDFNTIYTDLIKPTLESAGFESFRADEESSSGDILT